MNFELPLYAQEKRNTCALACLRMVLAAYGVAIQESELEAQALMEKRGTPIGELERLARHFNLDAEIRETTVEELAGFLAEGILPITFIDRAVFDLAPGQRHTLRAAKMHTVIPFRVTTRSVTFHDPLGPRVTRKTIRLFGKAYDMLGGRCVVCSKPES